MRSIEIIRITAIKNPHEGGFLFALHNATLGRHLDAGRTALKKDVIYRTWEQTLKAVRDNKYLAGLFCAENAWKHLPKDSPTRRAEVESRLPGWMNANLGNYAKYVALVLRKHVVEFHDGQAVVKLTCRDLLKMAATKPTPAPQPALAVIVKLAA